MPSSAAHNPEQDSPWLTNTLVVIGIGVSIGLIVVSAVLNFRVGYRTADTEFDGWVYGLGAGMADGLKAIAPFVAFWGWRNRDWLAVGASVVVFLVFSAYSFSAAVGFAAHHRLFKQNEQSGAFEKRKDLRGEYDRIEGRLKSLGVQRSDGEIEKSIATILARPVGERQRTVEQISSKCTLNRKDTREACTEVAGLAEEAERSREYGRLSKSAKELQTKLEGLKGGNASGDPQLDALEELVKMTPWVATRRNLEVGLSLLVALFIELGSGLGLYISTTPWRGREQKPGKANAGENEEEQKTGAEKRQRKEDGMSLGEIDDFMLERLEPRRGKELSGGDLFGAYRKWCATKKVVPFNREEFGRQFAELATLAGIDFTGKGSNGVYRDVAVSR